MLLPAPTTREERDFRGRTVTASKREGHSLEDKSGLVDSSSTGGEEGGEGEFKLQQLLPAVIHTGDSGSVSGEVGGGGEKGEQENSLPVGLGTGLARVGG